MTINSRLIATRTVLKKTPAYSMVVANEDGTFTNTITGKIDETIEDALATADLMKIADYRELTPAGIPLRHEGNWS